MQHKQAAQSIFMSSVTGLANVMAMAVTFFCVPEAYSRSIGWVQVFAEHRYGSDTLPLVSIAWFLILGLMIFFTARASVATLMVMGGLTLATKFL